HVMRIVVGLVLLTPDLSCQLVFLLFFSYSSRRQLRSTLFPYTTLFRSWWDCVAPICDRAKTFRCDARESVRGEASAPNLQRAPRSEEHTSELQSRGHLVCRLLLEKKNSPPSASARSSTTDCRSPNPAAP